MFRKILFPTDFSKGAEIAAEKFIEQNDMKIGEFIILHVIDWDTVDEFMEGYSLLYDSAKKELKDIEGKLVVKAKEKLENERKRFENRIPVEIEKIRTMVEVGTPHEEIVKVADKENVSVILLPSQGKMNLSHQFFGSVAMRVLRHTKRPVLVFTIYKEEK